MLTHRSQIVIDLINTGGEPPYRVFGRFESEDEEFIEVTGTVGDKIGLKLLVPKANVKLVTVLG